MVIHKSSSSSTSSLSHRVGLTYSCQTNRMHAVECVTNIYWKNRTFFKWKGNKRRGIKIESISFNSVQLIWIVAFSDLFTFFIIINWIMERFLNPKVSRSWQLKLKSQQSNIVSCSWTITSCTFTWGSDGEMLNDLLCCLVRTDSPHGPSTTRSIFGFIAPGFESGDWIEFAWTGAVP